MNEVRPLGTSELSTPPLVLGGNVFGWTADKATGLRVLDGGGTMVDTADVYSAWVPDDDAVPLDEALRASDTLVRAGKVRAIGASNFSADRLASALAISAREGRSAYAVLQPKYNPVSRAKFEGDLQQIAIDRTIGVLPYFGLASGFLTEKYRSEADFWKSRRGRRMPEQMKRDGPVVLPVIDAIADETGASQIALASLAARPGVTAPIASATSVAQPDDLLGAMTLALSPEQIARLDATRP